VHHVVLDHWSRGNSALHALDPRAKIIALLVFLTILATTPIQTTPVVFSLRMGAFLLILLAGAAAARLPVPALCRRAAIVLPFSLTFALVSWAAGERMQPLALVEKSYLSSLAALLVVATTPLPVLLRGLEVMGTPRVLVLTLHFLYRYLFVISEQAQHMRLAAACRQGTSSRSWQARFEAAAGAVAVLFARSYARAEGVHRAMLSRGFCGVFLLDSPLCFRPFDLVFVACITTAAVVIRLAPSWTK
jgi:cobalt/nickel transport system permease protein